MEDKRRTIEKNVITVWRKRRRPHTTKLRKLKMERIKTEQVN